MKLALIYDDLVQNGGGERLFLLLTKIFPDASIYVPIVGKYFLIKIVKKNLYYSKILSGFLKIPYIGYPLASFFSIFWFESLNLDKYTHVLSVSNRFSHTVKNSSAIHVSIVTTPLRQVWENKRKTLFISNFLRVHNFYSSKRPDYILAISKVVYSRVKKFWGSRNVNIIHIPLTKFVGKKYTYDPGIRDYYLIVGRPNKWKIPYFEKAIKILLMNNKKVVFIGSGTYLKYLKNKYPKVIYRSDITDRKLSGYYKNCIALVHPQVEDFGLTPLEALYYSKPTIAYNRGGVVDYLNSDISLLYNNNSEFINCCKLAVNFVINKKTRKKILQLHSIKNFEYNLSKILK